MRDDERVQHVLTDGHDTDRGGTSGADTQNDDAILDARTHSTYQIRNPLQMRER